MSPHHFPFAEWGLAHETNDREGIQLRYINPHHACFYQGVLGDIQFLVIYTIIMPCLNDTKDVRLVQGTVTIQIVNEASGGIVIYDIELIRLMARIIL